MKVAHNLDFSPKKGTNEPSDKSFLNFSRAQVPDNLTSIGICLGKRDSDIGNAIDRLNVIEHDRVKDQGRMM
jgi:hypothetical protein